MRLRKKVVAAVSSLVLATAVLAGCSSGDTATATTEVAATSTVDAATVDGTQDAAAVLAADKKAHSAGDASAGTVTIALTGSSATVSGEGVTVDGNTVTVTAAGTYRLSGQLDGQIVVNAPDATVTLILVGAVITSSATAAIAAVEAG
ncbi:carbohydrate-binding domain-containing protein, partial [Actinoplanes philippinensis]|uniref:carbohydrate-binding domain-containing protein n=1 Tax=Actinoplanes philippinensis TaxID=35752 RepID=UPI0033D9D10C